MCSFFLVGSMLNVLLLTPVTRASTQMEKKEGDFRFRHAEARSEAESLAFSDAGRVRRISELPLMSF